MKKKIEDALKTRSGPSFGIVLNPHVVTHARALQDSPPPLPDPDQTGSISSADINTLYTIATYPAKKWNVTGYDAFDLAEFTGFINMKTQQTPSYYTAYQQTLALYNSLVQSIGQPQALDYLYTPNPATPPANWETVRNWSIQEYLILFITSGNFRSYGWKNFPGWMGGAYNDPNNLPYRGI